MRTTRFTLLALAALALPATAHAQRVSADVIIGAGPVTGRVIVGDDYHYHPYYPRPVYREVVVVRHYRGYGWYRHHGYRSARVYYDPHRHVYYDRAYRPGLRVVAVYERDGRYYYDGRDGYRGDYRDGYRDDRRNDYRGRTDRYHDDDRY